MKKVFLLASCLVVALLFTIKRSNHIAESPSNVSSFVEQTATSDRQASSPAPVSSLLPSTVRAPRERANHAVIRAVEKRAVQNAALPASEEIGRNNYLDALWAAGKHTPDKETIEWLQMKEDTLAKELELRRKSQEVLLDSSMHQVREILGEPSKAAKIVTNAHGHHVSMGTYYRTNGTEWLYSPHPVRKDGSGATGDRFSVLVIWFDETDTLKEAKWQTALKN